VTSPLPIPAPNYGIDADRFLGRDSLRAAIRRRWEGRYAVDEFGGDPHLMDVFAPVTRAIRVDVGNGDVLPRSGPALLVANRGLGVLEPFVLGEAVRKASGRRLRVVGAPEMPVLGPAIRKLGGIGYRPDDVAAMLRAGHLAAAPLGPTWRRGGAGEPPRELVVATLGFPVIPLAIRPGGPASLPLRPWRVAIGAPLLPPAGTDEEDQLAAAELAEQVRDAVGALLEELR
jgi:1-acyl-sn-glycerol-3-phosphate acyltransferase